MHRRVVLGLALKILKSSDLLLRMVKGHENADAGAFIFKAATKAAEELGLNFEVRKSGRRRGDNFELASDLQPDHLRA